MEKTISAAIAMSVAAFLRVIICNWLDARKERKRQKANPNEVVIEQFTPEFVNNAPSAWRRGFLIGRKLGFHRH